MTKVKYERFMRENPNMDRAVLAQLIHMDTIHTHNIRQYSEIPSLNSILDLIDTFRREQCLTNIM